MPLVLTSLALFLLVSFVSLHFVSKRENEKVAARRSLLLAFCIPVPLLVVAWISFPFSVSLGWLILSLSLGGAIILSFPTGTTQEFAQVRPRGRIDERSIMFARAELKPGTEKFERYYELNPQHRQPDDQFRKLPGLMSEQAGKFEALTFTAAGVSFSVVEELAGLINGNVAAKKKNFGPAVVTSFLKGWATKLGAEDVGVAELEDYHFYTVKGRGDGYGQEINSTHRFALAFTVEMDHENLGTAPEGPALMESAQQYLNAGTIAVQLAVLIRQLGFAAEAHIDGNYKVICPLVCRDAGLGEIGRMGLLMTPRLGPRVRLAIVTTDLPMIADEPIFDPSVLDFCAYCRKCAEVCPVQAIPAGEQTLVDGVPRWQLDSEACFTYWCAVGTDCGQCMKVCPYSHPDTLLHNLVRLGLGRSFIFRKFALRMDDLIYGRSPKPLPLPDWVPPR